MQVDKQENDSFDNQFSSFFRKGLFSVSEKQLSDHFYWLKKPELQKLLNGLIHSGKIIRVGNLYTFSVFKKTLDKLVQMISLFNVDQSKGFYTLSQINQAPIGVIHTNLGDREVLVQQIIKSTNGKVFLVAQDVSALRSFSYSPKVQLREFSDLFTESGQIGFITSVEPNDRIVLIDGNFMTIFLFFLCVTAITKEHTFNKSFLTVLIDLDYDANLFAGGFLRSFYHDLKIPLMTHSQLLRNNPNFLREFVEGGEYFSMQYLNEGDDDSKIYLSMFKQLDALGLDLIEDVVFISTVETGRFSVLQTKWVICSLLKLIGFDVIEAGGDATFFIGEKIRAKRSAVKNNYADEYKIVGFDKNTQLVTLTSLIDYKQMTINVTELPSYNSSSFIHINDVAHQNYKNGVLLMPLAGLHNINDSDLIKFVTCFKGYRLILSQKVYIAHALSNRHVKFQNSFIEFLE